MNLYIAGGCNEHGRNSFLITGDSYSILVDCGAIEDDSYCYPYLTKQQIQSIQFLFLTHSHKDHAGAVNWLIGNGFQGIIICSEETRQQSLIKYSQWQILSLPGQNYNRFTISDNLYVTYGKSGHCVGSLWYLLNFENKSILFSGDYSEESSIYECDKLSGLYADFAVLDCGGGNTSFDNQDNRTAIRSFVLESIKNNKIVLLPVPKYGRGTEIIDLFQDECEELSIYLDEILACQMTKQYKSWYKKTFSIPINLLNNWNGVPAVLFASDAQLSNDCTQALANKVIGLKGDIVFTGHIYKNTYSDFLIRNNMANVLDYPVHMGYSQVVKILKKNSFRKVILYHSPEKIENNRESVVEATVRSKLSI
ncbi:MBL fold metallo-hydrolase [Blautia coccoides]|uniref:MBL fold metallo-hydrolase n=1 Tax=Blautia producta TaxID=33035 RepID=UPI00214A778A|nr:MBL fold metallo-hydrolase [Blautia coccoides]MCR1984857.1 MBL fold metallo-hydrolase [Blautia coccoides]